MVTERNLRWRWISAAAAALVLVAMPQPVNAHRPVDPGAPDGYSVPADQVHVVDTPHFRLHFTEQGTDAAAPRFVKLAGGVFEEVWAHQVQHRGWPSPAPDGGRGGDDRVDVYLLDTDVRPDAPFGYAVEDTPVSCGACARSGHLVIDNDYEGFAANPEAALRATAAHEFGHLVGFRVAPGAEGWAAEATAVWLERDTFPEADARTAYLEDFAGRPDLSLTDFAVASGGFDRSYGAYVWNAWLAERHGPDVVRDAWEQAGALGDHVTAGYDAALRARGTSFAGEFVAFATATAGWERGGFPVEVADYPPVARAAPLHSGEERQVKLDHAAYHVADVIGADTVTVTARGPKFVAGGLALVAGWGNQVRVAVDDTLHDGLATVSMSGLVGAHRVTVVVVNADVTGVRDKPAGGDPVRHLHDGVEYRVGVDVDPGPRPKVR